MIVETDEYPIEIQLRARLMEMVSHDRYFVKIGLLRPFIELERAERLLRTFRKPLEKAMEEHKSMVAMAAMLADSERL